FVDRLPKTRGSFRPAGCRIDGQQRYQLGLPSGIDSSDVRELPAFRVIPENRRPGAERDTRGLAPPHAVLAREEGFNVVADRGAEAEEYDQHDHSPDGHP